MKHKTMDTRYMATLAMLCGVLLVMGMTGIGFIPLPVIKATTMHIPTPGLLSFAFSPFMTTEGLVGVVKSLWIALGCRILFGALAGWLWLVFRKMLKTEYAALPVTAAVATICHTLLVMGSIYVLLTQQYAAAKNVAISAVFGLIMGTVTASGIPEAIAAAILVTVIGKALLHLLARMKKR